jgi:broad specificity phosphatase PhoE
MMTRRFIPLLCVIAFCLTTAAAQTIFVVRHAERTGEPDPPLNAEGVRRAQSLAKVLADANVKHFYASEMLRTQQTAEPSAKAAGKRVEVKKQTEMQGLIQAIRATAAGDEATLVVGHGNTVPQIVEALSGVKIPPIRSDEHDRLIVVTLQPGGRASVVTLRY